MTGAAARADLLADVVAAFAQESAKALGQQTPDAVRAAKDLVRWAVEIGGVGTRSRVPYRCDVFGSIRRWSFGSGRGLAQARSS